MTAREGIYALLALTGAVVTWFFNLKYVAEGGSFLDMGAIANLLFANSIVASFTADILVAFATFAVWSVVEARRLGMRAGWIYPLLGLTVAFAFAFPLFLFVRERHLRRSVTG
ncbi:MAG TPA: DUF2834 domain-containing protein [Thermoanaerobaculia bacterium]|nr:DUF2834 domain-containing protein [Thermoanaerobaculia bacterium]